MPAATPHAPLAMAAPELPTAWHPVQEPALVSAKAMGSRGCVLARDTVVGQGNKAYGSMLEPPRGTLPNMNMYELVPGRRLRHMLLDVDCKESTFKGFNAEDVISVLRANVEALHGTGELPVQIMTASGAVDGDYKHSFHVVFPTTSFTHLGLRAFVKLLEERLKPFNYPVGVPDFSIYTVNRAMRALGQSKLGSDRVLVPYGASSDDAFDHLWCIYEERNRDVVEVTWTDPTPPPPPYVAPVREFATMEARELFSKCEDLIDCLSVERATKYDTWFGVGSAAYHISNGDPAFLDLWDAWSRKQAPNSYSFGCCDEKWRTMARPTGGATNGMGSLRYWAKMDDPAAFADIVNAEREEREAATSADMTQALATLAVTSATATAEAEHVHVPTIPTIPDNVWSWKPSGTETFAVVKEKFELYNFKITQGGTFGRFIRGSRIPTFNTEAQMKTMYRDWHCSDEKDTCFINMWLNDVNKHRFETIDFAPPPHVLPDYTFNTFYGFAASRIVCEPAEDMSVILDMVDILAGRDAAVYDYVLNWMAACVQRPAVKKDATAILFYGEQGVGKNLLIEFFGNKIIGPDYYKKPQNVADTVFGRFADSAENTVLLFMDETKWLHKYNDALKDLITSEDVNVEHKGQMPRRMRNCMHIMMASNNLDVLKVELSDRRYVIVQSSSEKKGDIDYFNKLAQWMDEESNQRGFYNFLMTRDLSNVHLQAQRPVTDMYVNAKIDSLPLVTKWLIERVKDAAGKNDTFTLCRGVSDREAFRDWAKRNGARADTIFTDKAITTQLVALGVESGNNVRVDHERAYRYDWAAVKESILRVTKLGDILFAE